MALVFSLAINLLFIGALAGRMLNRQHAGPMPRHLSWMLRDLDPRIRQQLLPQMQNYAEKARPLHKSILQAQGKLRAALATEPFDEEALTSALSELQMTSNGLQTSMHKEIVTLAKQLGPEQRIRIARFLSSPRRGGRHRPDGDRNEKE
jgi:uncharacterized membrane protein